MGADPHKGFEVGVRTPRIGNSSTRVNSQKYKNRQRDQMMISGTLQLAQTSNDTNLQEMRIMLKTVNQLKLPSYRQNHWEKQHFASPDHLKFMQSKSRNPFDQNYTDCQRFDVNLSDGSSSHYSNHSKTLRAVSSQI